MKLAKIHQSNTFQEPVWHVFTALGIAALLQIILNDSLTFGPKYVIVGLEIILALILGIFPLTHILRRLFAIVIIALISIVNVISLGIVIHALFVGAHIDGHQLLISSVAIYLTNIIVFGLWFWELDTVRSKVSDFQFPQSGTKSMWKPTFFDYLYVSITNATAFSPTDTLPLSHRAKLLMTLQSIVSLAIVVLVTARAVNILS
jgi:uncharacterized membrane protein